MYLLNNAKKDFITSEKFYFKHGAGHKTVAILGMEPMIRSFAKSSLPAIENINVEFEVFNADGSMIRKAVKTYSANEEVVFKSEEILDEMDRAIEGAVQVNFPDMEVEGNTNEIKLTDLKKIKESFNGILLVYKPGQFITGVHLYHGITKKGFGFLFKYYLRNLKLILSNAFSGLIKTFQFSQPWAYDAVGATIVKSTPSTNALAIFHNDNYFPGVTSYLERRFNSTNYSRMRIPALPVNSTCVFKMKHQEKFNGKWNNLLFPTPPLGVSRFLAGEEFENGSICIDHTYFQQSSSTPDTKVTKEVKYFDKNILKDPEIIGPSHPWPLIHNHEIKSLIAFTNQLFPEIEKRYDLIVYDEVGKEVLEIKDFIELEPYGTCVKSVSEELTKRGIDKLDGCYLIKHSINSPSQKLTNRIHGQGIYEFKGQYWNAVQSDASIWSSPENKVPEIESLSLAKVRRKQYWYAPILCDEEIDSIIALHNLSYHKKYDQKQTLCLRLATGNKIIAEKDIEIEPFGSAYINAADFFKEEMSQLVGNVGHIVVYPKTGITYCGSFLIKDKKTEIFMIEHFLKIPKYKHEISS